MIYPTWIILPLLTLSINENLRVSTMTYQIQQNQSKLQGKEQWHLDLSVFLLEVNNKIIEIGNIKMQMIDSS